MAKSKTRSLNRSKLRSRVGRNVLTYTTIASAPALPRTQKFTTKIRSSNQLLLDLARLSGVDNRRYDPLASMRPARTVTGRSAWTFTPKAKPLSRVKPKFETPKTVAVCVRRGVRKEVLFAKRRAGRNGMRRARRTAFSNFSC